MAIGITSYGAYVPLHRLGPGVAGWTARNERAVASFDEDSVTMAVAAARNCLEGVSRGDIGAVYLASTTPPYKEKENATIVGVASDLPAGILAVDFTSSLRAGTSALQAALDAVKGGSAKRVVVTASDMRVPQPRSEFEPVFGDGAAALLIGEGDVAVEFEDSFAVSDEILDVWKADGDPFIRTWEDRFVVEEGYLKVLPQVISKLLERNGLTIKEVDKVVFYGPDSRRHGEVAKKLGVDPKAQVPDALFSTVGNTGAASALMMLVAALDEAKAGERILLANYGNGADAFLFRVTERIEAVRKGTGIRTYIDSKKMLSDYETYAAWRGLINKAPPARRPALRMPSPSAMHREVGKNIRYHGTKCANCGYPQYPPQRVCTRCHAKDQFEDYSFADKKATVFTYTMDRLGPTLDPPMVVTVIDFDGGGRAFSIMTDRDVNKLEIGMPVEMTFRRFYSTEGIHNYYWRCMPVRA